MATLPSGILRFRLFHGFKPEERSGVFVSQQIQKTVRALPHFPESLFEFDEQRLATGWFAFRVKNDPLQLSAAKGAHYNVALQVAQSICSNTSLRAYNSQPAASFADEDSPIGQKGESIRTRKTTQRDHSEFLSGDNIAGRPSPAEIENERPFRKRVADYRPSLRARGTN